MDFAADFRTAIADAVKETGVSLKGDLAKVSAYAAQRATFLATLVGQPGFEAAVRAERDAVALFAGVTATLGAKAADARVVGIIQGALAIGAKAIAVAAA